MKRRLAIFTGLVIAATITVGAFYGRGGEPKVSLTTGRATRGSVVNKIAATGTLEAVTTVQVGSQVSGTIESLNADFNSIVRKGQVLARLDQSLFRTAVEQAQANVARAVADEQRVQVALSDSRTKLARAQQLAEKQLIPANDLADAEVARATAEAQVRSAAASVTQAKASLLQAQVNLSKTVITAPISGIVISRNVDVGQTVAASLSAPTLFVLAADLAEMQLNASIDESDLGDIESGQPVAFTVDAYPGQTFNGIVEQVRLNPVVQSNVVTYAAIITAPNPDLKLKPGMTATVDVEVARRDNVLRVPAAALRFKPTAQQIAEMNAVAADNPRRQPVVWVTSGGGVTAVPITAGLSDGTWTEVMDAPFAEGAEVVTRLATSQSQATTQPAAVNNPLMGTAPRRR
jgi:HlyD family secretion protein